MFPIEISNVKKSYGPLKAVDGVSFSVKEGEIFSLLGPNGAGKTTLIEILEGLRKLDEGEVKVLGLDPWQNGDSLHKKIGVMPQNFSFADKSTPKEAIRYYSKLFGVRVNEDQIISEVLLEDAVNTLFENLSGGQKQKMGLALSLVNSPELLFLDEPTTGLDPNARRAVWDVIRKLKASGKTIMLTTHYLEEAEHLADRVAIMNRGHIIATGTCDEIIRTFGSGEVLEVRGRNELANYLKENTKLRISYDPLGKVRVSLEQEHDAYLALAAIEESGLGWSDLRTKQDSLEDVFVKLVGGVIEEHGEIKHEVAASKQKEQELVV
jgi:ABC-2 type transport system ATP-binding protein